MPRSEMIEMDGVVTEALPGLKFRVKAHLKDGNPEQTTELICVPSGKIKTNYVRILVGDDVMVEVSPYDLGKGRIVWRYK